MKSTKNIGIYSLLLLMALLSACSSNVVKSTSHTPVIQENVEIAEALLLDVGIDIFNPGLDKAADEDALIFPEVRHAESRFIPVHIMDALQISSAWGTVRVVPMQQSSADVFIRGEILQSDGELLELEVHVSDASGKTWFKRDYKELASRYAYDPRNKIKADPFQNIYNRIANDMLLYKRRLDTEHIRTVRTIAELQFAQSFSPETFGGHLDESSNGKVNIKRLPAENDPMLQRVRQIRERDYLFVDTLQDYYTAFSKEMESPYREWRKHSYDEAIAMRSLQRSARNRTIAGVAAIIGGILAHGSDNGAARAAGNVAIAGGAYAVKSGFDKRAEAQMHVEALQELGDSMEANIAPQVIELEDRTITLSGSVENQYNQWRDILREIYHVDTGESVTSD